MVSPMQINPAYRPATSEQARAAAMAEATLLLQDVGTMVTAHQVGSTQQDFRWTENARLRRNGAR
jgi:hypothetical protein